MPAFGIGVGASIKEQLDGVQVSVPGGWIERSSTVFALDIDVCACFKQPADDADVPFSSGFGPMSMDAHIIGAPPF